MVSKVQKSMILMHLETGNIQRACGYAIVIVAGSKCKAPTNAMAYELVKSHVSKVLWKIMCERLADSMDTLM